MKIKHVLIAVLFSLISCEKKTTIEGMWLVKSVKVGEDEITPNSRWMKFNSNFTQQSGNGWQQHSIGTWKLDQNSHELTIHNTNGLDDLNEPFRITLSENDMIWKRKEENKAVEIRLEKIQQLPPTLGDQLLGLWKLENTIGSTNYFPRSKDTESFLFFRWDKRFVIGSASGRKNGVYNVHGHKPEVELIPYNKQLERSFWNVQLKENTILLRLLNTDSTVTRTFKRIHKFPQ